MGDRCWLSLLAQVAGLVAARRGQPADAMTLLADSYSGQALTAVAERDRMPEYAVRAAVWEHRLGDAGAGDRARRRLAAVDNPALAALVGAG